MSTNPFWYCSNCCKEVDKTNITPENTHDTCGTHVYLVWCCALCPYMKWPVHDNSEGYFCLAMNGREIISGDSNLDATTWCPKNVWGWEWDETFEGWWEKPYFPPFYPSLHEASFVFNAPTCNRDDISPLFYRVVMSSFRWYDRVRAGWLAEVEYE